MAEENTAENPESTSEAPAKGGNGKLKLLALLSVAMIGEAGLFYFLGIGAGPEAAAAGEDAPTAKLEPQSSEEKDATELAEIEIHSFNITNNMAAADSIVHVAFKLHALVAADQASAFDEAANKKNKARVREAIEKVTRSATLEDLNDPTLSTLKRLLREEINKVLRQSYIIEVVFSDFKTMEQ